MKRKRKTATGSVHEMPHIHRWRKAPGGWKCTATGCLNPAAVECVASNRRCYAGRCLEHRDVPNYPAGPAVTGAA